ncbi:dihydrofolate reductase [Vibrio phage 1.063.O._10N.261.45.C7]|nr:dihydrofolate reductase [Vibrio phage 1.063.O._10N.261.45.C7]
MIKMIMALGLNNELGSTTTPDGLPWERNLEDMKYFRDQTLGSTVIYGKTTYKSFIRLGMEDGLPQRVNWVLSNDVNPLSKVGYLTVGTNTKFVNLQWLTSWMRLLTSTEDLWIIGGKSIYDQLHPYAEEVHITRINQDFLDADVYLDTSWLCDFEKVKEVPLNDYSHVEIYKRKEK